jgi:hypothetical protein
MEGDLVVALESLPNKLKVTSSMKIFFSIVDGSSEAKGVAPLPTVALAEVITHFNVMTDPMFFNTIAKEG